jgi:hypothetical protein
VVQFSGSTIVIADEDDRVGRGEMAEDEAGQGAAEFQPGPGGARQDALIIGAMPRCEPAEGAEQVGDGASPGRQDGGGRQEDEAVIGRGREGGGEGREQRQGLVG